MARLLKGADVASAIDSKTKVTADELAKTGITPTLAIVRVGENPGDMSYERGAAKRAGAVGVGVKNFVCAPQTTTGELINVIKDINSDAGIHGCLLLRPLPKHIDEDAVRNALDVAKDVDCACDLSLAGVFASSDGAFANGCGYAPCTAQACMEILDYYGVELAGKNAVVVGRSLVVGKPVAMMLLAKQASVTICHSHTRGLPAICKGADVVVACIGKALFLGREYFRDAPRDAAAYKGRGRNDTPREGQVVIDVGVNMTAGGKLVGDVDFGEAEKLVSAITPVPGGVGAVTTSVLMQHVVDAAKKASNV
ncbi:MAG: bifunctional 5,10-methylenetetrahydrofolate dehydrogenase/5,10-methenyltetrahydrofolate cyclohydrolase [Coriobacteriales bacterium]|jgi:methylenetetrahydrofolate dehydrogenase (NADP+)/methenyltetrahydrofolate cyclohydrolase|nr:bifunctional 5,10-methylenetetrahydrofolate dehydrogenase/5,10-methenyltetrahydrofolate cyclohydrolase [Coriobacteriales bacterium]